MWFDVEKGNILQYVIVWFNQVLYNRIIYTVVLKVFYELIYYGIW
jgi:hypothetical protein